MPLESGQEAEPDDDAASAGEAKSEYGAEPARRLRACGHLIARREVERAVAKLEARGELTDAQRLAVEAMAHRIVESVLESPTDAADGEVDSETAGAVMALFDLDEER